MQWVQRKWKCGTNVSKMVENLLKAIHVLEGLQQAEHLRMLNVYGLHSTKINNWQRNRSWYEDPKNYCIQEFDAGMKRVVAKFIPPLLLPEQKEHHATVANDLIQTATSEPDFLKNAITGDKLWSTALIQKRRPSHPNGSCLILHNWRRRGRITARSKPC